MQNTVGKVVSQHLSLRQRKTGNGMEELPDGVIGRENLQREIFSRVNGNGTVCGGFQMTEGGGDVVILIGTLCYVPDTWGVSVLLWM